MEYKCSTSSLEARNRGFGSGHRTQSRPHSQNTVGIDDDGDDTVPCSESDCRDTVKCLLWLVTCDRGAVTEVRCLDKYKQKDKYMRYMLNPY